MADRNHPYAAESNPWTNHEDLLRATAARGAIVSAWAQLDGYLTEVIARSARYLAYQDLLPPKFPSQRPKRIELLSSMLQAEGPLHRWRREGQAYLDHFGEADEVRNILAHAQMQVLPMWGVTFKEYLPVKGGGFVEKPHRVTVEQLEEVAVYWARFSRRVDRIVRVMQNRGLLPAIGGPLV